ncbi:polyprenyl synthetase family protein [Methanosalsum natronophilum]|uniref:Polyprenyl synthetase family protein n=1 Tax=Methanosalsum natronophilum TaxID=768733 RepID=A0A3R7XUP1_9EURY|nr:polyprenyl synthetase family protein [Methanosalsum natronophilum]MCS3924631.1 geranylgeranyl diphosphate synthase type I [Methanosalsum natronophilum]RQD85403.1 MAG: polyprenyl synthetase family protein [Methanosalsum natronophilum]
MPNIIDELRGITADVDEEISKMLPINQPVELYRASRYLPDAGGKRLRPATLLLAAQAVGANLDDILPAAVSVELVHNFTLIHDDIMDEDPVRRGMEAVHVKWGCSGAILAGDTLYSKAFEIISGMDNDPDRLNKSIGVLSKTCTQICEGQWMDIEFENRDDVTKEEYLKMVEKKTSVLYAAAAKVGAILGGASEEVADALYDYGRLVGVGFQIYDDVLDLITPEEILGKSRGSDILEGKKTLIAIHAREKNVDINIFGKGKATNSEIEASVQLLHESGSIKYAEELAFSYIREGKEKLEVLPDSDAKDKLKRIADYMIERDY